MTWKLFYDDNTGLISSCSKSHIGDMFIEIDTDDAINFMTGKIPLSAYRVFNKKLVKLVVDTVTPTTTSGLTVIGEKPHADLQLEVVDGNLEITPCGSGELMHYLTVTPTITIYVCEKDNLQYLIDSIEVPSSTLLLGKSTVFFGNHTNYDLVTDSDKVSFSVTSTTSILSTDLELIDADSGGDLITFKKIPSGFKVSSSIPIHETLMISIESNDGSDSVMASYDMSTGKAKMIKFSFDAYSLYANINPDKVSVV